MGDEKAQRLDDALSSLVDTLIPVLPDDDEATADERHDDALDLARGIIEGHVLPKDLSLGIANVAPKSRQSCGSIGRQSCCRLDQEEA